MDSQRDMVRASLEAEHDHGTYCRRKAERRDGDRRDPATTITVDRERLEKIELLLMEAESESALAEIRSILGGDHAG